MVVRFVCVFRVPACARVSRVSRVCPGSLRCLFTGTIVGPSRDDVSCTGTAPGTDRDRVTLRTADCPCVVSAFGQVPRSSLSTSPSASYHHRQIHAATSDTRAICSRTPTCAATGLGKVSQETCRVSRAVDGSTRTRVGSYCGRTITISLNLSSAPIHPLRRNTSCVSPASNITRRQLSLIRWPCYALASRWTGSLCEQPTSRGRMRISSSSFCARGAIDKYGACA